jgi:hypothetical protein
MFTRKNSKIVVSSAILALSLGFGAAGAWALESVVSKDVVASTALGGEGNYCHLKFPAIDRRSFGSNNPVLQSAATGDMVDYYGPCDHDPLGKEEITRQMHEEQLLLERDGSE